MEDTLGRMRKEMINLKALSKAVFDGQNIRGLEDPVILDSL
jgi:hypothetical protein